MQNTIDLSPRAACRPAAPAALCPFHDGPETLDGLLVAIDPRDSALLDTALDLRHALSHRNDAEETLAQVFRLRRLLDGRHYLAFYRLRCWLQRLIFVQARSHRGEPWQTFPLPLDGARIDEIVDSTLARLASGPELPASAHVRFAFAAPALPPALVATTAAAS